MKSLLLDAGNTRLKWAICEEGQLSHQGSVRYEWASLETQLEGVFSKLLVEIGPVDGVTMSNVAGKALAVVMQEIMTANWAGRLVSKAQHTNKVASLEIKNVVAQSNAYGVRCAYENPAQLGPDRWAALVAARHYGTGTSCIIDCGTAMTVDVLTADGNHAGGIIIPGMEMMKSSLFENTEGIFASKHSDLSPLAVTSTAGAVQAGVVAAMRGAIEQVLKNCRDELGVTPNCVLTGGNAEWVLPGLPDTTTVEADWVLKGLAIIAAADQ